MIAQRTLGRWLLLASLLLGGGIRVSSYARVHADQRWYFEDGDSYYHLRRIGQTIARGGRVPMFDPWLSYPEGDRVPWHAGYDLLVAAPVAVLCGAQPARPCLESVSAWSTPLLGLIAIAVVFWLGRTVGGELCAGLSALLFALYPWSAGSALLGHVDHHVLEPVLPALWFIALSKGRPLLAGALFAAALAVFPSALWPIAITSGALLFDRLVRLRSSAQTDLTLVRVLGCASVLAVPVVWTSAYPTSFEPVTSALHLVSLVAGLLVAGCVELVVRWAPQRRFSAVIGLLGVSAAAAIVLGWKQLQPLLLFGEAGGLWTGVVQQASLVSDPVAFALLVGIALAAGMYGYRRGLQRGELGLRLVALSSPVLFLAGVAQIRFLMVASSLALVTLAFACVDGGAALLGRLEREPPRTQRLGRLTMTALGSLLFVPMSEYLPHAGTARANPMHAVIRLLDRVGAQRLDPRRGAVLSTWPFGHHILYFLGVPTVASPFIVSGHDAGNVEGARALLEERPDRLYELMQRRHARYLLVTSFDDPESVAPTVGLRTIPEHSAGRVLMRPTLRGFSELALVDAEPGARLFEHVPDRPLAMPASVAGLTCARGRLATVHGTTIERDYPISSDGAGHLEVHVPECARTTPPPSGSTSSPLALQDCRAPDQAAPASRAVIEVHCPQAVTAGRAAP